MTGLGRVMAGDLGLEVSIPRQDWDFLLRRADLMPDARFARYHGTDVGSRDVAAFLPNWGSLRWLRVPDNLLSRSESCGIDELYQVNVKSLLLAVGRPHDELVAAFLRFMAHSTD